MNHVLGTTIAYHPGIIERVELRVLTELKPELDAGRLPPASAVSSERVSRSQVIVGSELRRSGPEQ